MGKTKTNTDKIKPCCLLTRHASARLQDQQFPLSARAEGICIITLSSNQIVELVFRVVFQETISSCEPILVMSISITQYLL